jgi:hypothetical protein
MRGDTFLSEGPATGGEPLYKAAALSVCSRRLPEAAQDQPSFLTFAYFVRIGPIEALGRSTHAG